jgi:hypothetical protein
MPWPEHSTPAAGKLQPGGVVATGWAAFRALRQRPTPMRRRLHGNHRHGRYAKRSMEARRRFRLWMRWLRGGKVGGPVPGLPPPEHPGWRRCREPIGCRGPAVQD